MVVSDALAEARLPTWLVWYLNYGVEEADTKKRRQQLMAKLILGLSASLSSAYVIFYLLIGPGFQLIAFSAFLQAVIFFVAAFTFLRSPATTLIIGVSLVGLVFCWQSYLTSSSSGAHLFMMLTPVFWIAILGATNIGLLIFATVTGITTILFCEALFEAPILPAARNDWFLQLNFGLSISVLMLFALVFGFAALFRAERAEEALQAEHARSEALLYNLLPEDIAARLKVQPDQTIADSLPKVAILFADIVEFTPRASSLRPEEVVGFLNKVFRAFDDLAEKHGLEKIKTIGDAYMVAAGMPNPCGDPVRRVAEMALDMQRTVANMADEFPDGLQVRIGLHSGPAVAGVIGSKKLFYDVWGETVNTASRMESHGEPGRIQVTGPAYEELVADYLFERRGKVDVKGMGSVETWWLTGKAVS